MVGKWSVENIHAQSNKIVPENVKARLYDAKKPKCRVVRLSVSFSLGCSWPNGEPRKEMNGSNRPVCQ